MIESIRTLPVEQVVSGIGAVAQTARDADRELTLALAYAHRVMSPPLSLRVLSSACGLSPSTIRTRVHAPGVLEEVRGHIEHDERPTPSLEGPAQHATHPKEGR